MSEIIRDTFIAVHSSEVLEKLRAEVSPANIFLLHPLIFLSQPVYRAI